MKRKLQLIGDDGYVIIPKKNTIKKKKITADDFERLKVIGKGKWGKVVLVRYKKNPKKDKFYAMKIIGKRRILEENEVEYTKTERVVLQLFSHPYIVKLYFAFQTKTCLYLVMNHVAGGDLFFHIQQKTMFPEKTVKLWAAELLLALSFLHENNILYRDIKPENILMDGEGHLILSDFGLAKILNEDEKRASTPCGTVDYLAPEVLRGKTYTRTSDYWGYGTILYELLFGGPPFYCEDDKEQVRRICKRKLKFPRYHLNPVSKEAKDFITKLLVKDPSKRLGAKKIDELKDHKWFSDLNFDDVYARKVKSPYKINTTNPLSHVDPDFVNASLDSPTVSRSFNITESDDRKFEGFDFINSKLSFNVSTSFSEEVTPSVLYNKVSIEADEDTFTPSPVPKKIKIKYDSDEEKK